MKVVKKVFNILFSFIFGMLMMDYIISKNNSHKENQKQLEKIFLYYNIFNMWLDCKQQGKSLSDYMNSKGYKNVAIYGMKELGERLYVELINLGVNVVCVIDNNKSVLGDFILLSPEDEIPSIDLLIITADYHFADIKEMMEKKVACPIISLSGLLGNAFGRAG